MGIKLNGLTPKQEKIAQLTAKQILETGQTNQTQTGLQVFDTDNPNSARVMTSQELQKPTVKARLEEILEASGLSLTKIGSNLSNIANKTDVKFTGDQVLKANIEALKLFNAYPSKNTTHTRLDVKAKIKDVDYKDARTMLDKMRGKNDILASDQE